MRTYASSCGIALVFLVGALGAGRVEAAEYRLRVASLYESAFVYFLSPAHLTEGPSAPALDRLETTLDRAGLPAGVLLYDRRVEPAPPSLARIFGVNPVRPKPEGESPAREQWTELRWEGTPGDRSVWIVAPTAVNTQELRHLGLKGTGKLRYVIPYGAPLNGARLPSVRLPLNFIGSVEDPGRLWEAHLARPLDLSEGIAVVVGENPDGVFADHVFIVVNHAPQPTTYKVVLGWQRRFSVDLGQEGPGNDLAR